MSYQLNVRVIEAKNIAKMDVFSKSDPYVVLSIDGSKKTKTETKSNTLTPRWNQEFHFTINDIARQCLVLNMYDEDINKDDHMASLEIQMSSLPFGQVLDQWYDMIPSKRAKKGGQIHLVFHLAPMGATPFVNIMMQPGMMQPGMMQPGMMQPGMMQPGMMQPGMMQPGMMQPGMMQPGMMQPGMMQPGMGNFQSAMMGMANVGNSMMGAVPGSGMGMQPGMQPQYGQQAGMQPQYGQQAGMQQQYPGSQPGMMQPGAAQQYPGSQPYGQQHGSNPQYPPQQGYPAQQGYSGSQQYGKPQAGYSPQQLNSTPNPYDNL